MRCVHVRRALLLFAIVLGVAALAASLSRPQDERQATAPAAGAGSPSPTLSPGSAGTSTPVTASMSAEANERQALDAGRPATLEVSVEQPGEIAIPLLGLSAAAEPLTPARFELLPSETGRYPVEFTPAAGDESRSAGTLVVREPGA